LPHLKKLIALAVSSFLLFFVVLVSTRGSFRGKINPPKTTPEQDLSNHPIYSKYQFNNTENTINIGIQPLWTPTGFITETLKRDNVLLNALSELGKKIQFFSFLKGDDVNFFLTRKDIDAGIGGDMPAIRAASTLDLIIPALIQQGFCSIVANRHMQLRELRYEPIGFAFGSNAHYALLNALKYEGIASNQTKLVPMDVTEMPSALHSGEITAFSAWEPTPSISKNKHSNNVIIHRSQSSGYLYFLKSFSDKNPEAVRQIVAAEIRSIKWMQSDIKNLFKASQWALSASKILSGKPILLTVEQNANLAQKDIIGLLSEPIIPRKYLKHKGPLHKEYDFLKSLGKISASISWKKVRGSFDRKIIKEIMDNKKKYKINQFKYKVYQNEN